MSIQGNALGTDFRSYRLQVGEGLNPQNWLAITDEITTPVSNGHLGSWDTSGFNGLYAIQLIVVRSEQRVDTDTIQVTIDNQPPDVSIPYPEDGQTFDYQASVPITFQIQVSDNLGLALVEYHINDILIETQTQPPFAFPWLPEIGKHTLLVKAYDLAGNQISNSVAFSVEK